MKITVVDTVELAQEHITQLNELGDVTIYTDVPDADELNHRLCASNIAVLGWSAIDEAALSGADDLRMISLWSTGYDYVDLNAAKNKNIAITNVPGYASDTISELAIGLCIAGARKILEANEYVRSGGARWQDIEGVQLKGKTLGVVGAGPIGGALARLGNCLGMRVIASTRNPSEERADTLGVKFVSTEELFKESDFISMHCSLNESTREMVNDELLSNVKKGAYFVNTARAELVDEHALIAALESEKLSGAALDVIDTLPLETDHPFRSMKNVILSPHYAFNTPAAIHKKTSICIDNIASFLADKPTNVIT